MSISIKVSAIWALRQQIWVMCTLFHDACHKHALSTYSSKTNENMQHINRSCVYVCVYVYVYIYIYIYIYIYTHTHIYIYIHIYTYENMCPNTHSHVYIQRRIAAVQHVGLPNLLLGTTLVPELLFERCSAENIAQVVLPYLMKPQVRSGPYLYFYALLVCTFVSMPICVQVTMLLMRAFLWRGAFVMQSSFQ